MLFLCHHGATYFPDTAHVARAWVQGCVMGRKAKCPICGKQSVPEQKPFCSQRCQKIDLNRWLSGVYFVPGQDGEAAVEGAGDHEVGDDWNSN
jgi:Uncharacterized protein conserved in bacteria